jgi:cell division septation protein DedD
MADADPDALFEDDADAGGELAPPEEMGRGGRRRRAAARAGEDARAAGAEDEVAAASDEPASAAPPSAPPAPASTPPPASQAAAKPAAGGEPGFHIQVLATADRAKAEALVARLVDADFKAFIVPSNEGGRTMYRVRVGPFSDRTIAAGQAQELESRWGLDSWISPGSP